MTNDNRNLKRIIVCLIVLNLLVGGCIIALAEASKEVRNEAELELDALVLANETTRNLMYDAGAWDQQSWYAEWVSHYGLEGVYRAGWDIGYPQWEEEIAACDKAYLFWKESCGITPYNDYSMATEMHLVQHEKDGQVRYLMLLERVHDERMPSFYVLLEQGKDEILASSSVEEYKAHHQEMEKLMEQERRQEKQIKDKAVDAILEKYRDQLSWLNEAYFQDAEIQAFQTILLDSGSWGRQVYVIPGEGYDPEFSAQMDEQGEQVHSVRWYPERYGRYTQAQKQAALDAFAPLEEAYLQLLSTYGEAYRIPAEERLALQKGCTELQNDGIVTDFIAFSPLLEGSGFLGGGETEPHQDDISQESAREIVTKELMDRFKLTETQAKSLSWYGRLYQHPETGGRQWEFNLELGKERVFLGSVNAETGALLLLVRTYPQESRQDSDIIAALEARYGNWGQWPIEIKAHYAHIYLGGEHDYGLPGEGDLTLEEALETAKAALMAAYPELTREQLDDARLCPYFTAKPHMLYGTVYEPPIYYFAFDVDGISVGYEIIMDGRTGEIYLTHDPIHSGNG